MDERKSVIRDLEYKNRIDTDAINRHYENLGESLFQRIGDGEPFAESEGETPGTLLKEFRNLHIDIEESREIIKSLEADINRLKELDAEITEKEAEQSSLESDFDKTSLKLGEELMDHADWEDPLKPQEVLILAKINEQEEKQAELEGREGGIFAWIGKNAQMAVSKGIILKNKHSLQRLYRSAGEKFISGRHDYVLTGEAGESAEKARELKEEISAIAVNLAMLKGERRNMSDIFSAEGNPNRRISAQEKHIIHIQGLFPGVERRLGALAAAQDAEDELSSLLSDEDRQVIENIGLVKNEIAERELKIAKLNAAIKIDDENSEIEKLKKSILGQRQKITAAEEAIGKLETEISDAKSRIEELDLFIKQNGGL